MRRIHHGKAGHHEVRIHQGQQSLEMVLHGSSCRKQEWLHQGKQLGTPEEQHSPGEVHQTEVQVEPGHQVHLMSVRVEGSLIRVGPQISPVFHGHSPRRTSSPWRGQERD